MSTHECSTHCNVFIISRHFCDLGDNAGMSATGSQEGSNRPNHFLLLQYNKALASYISNQQIGPVGKGQGARAQGYP